MRARVLTWKEFALYLGQDDRAVIFNRICGVRGHLQNNSVLIVASKCVNICLELGRDALTGAAGPPTGQPVALPTSAATLLT